MKFEINRQINLDYYNKQLTEYGQDVKALSWGNVDSQRERFKILSEIGDLNDKSILDVGCGFGDFYVYLKGQDINPKQYVGIDINLLMISMAKNKLPEVRFEVADILTVKLKEKYDYVIASGIFALETPKWDAITEKILRKMYKLSQLGVGVNFLSSRTTGKMLVGRHYTNPRDMAKFASKKLRAGIVLRYDYRPNDFTLYIYKPSHQPNYLDSNYLPGLRMLYKIGGKGGFMRLGNSKLKGDANAPK